MATQLTGSVQVVAQALHSSSADQVHNLGEKVHTNDGRALRYCKAGGTSLVAGTMQQAPAEDATNWQNLTASVNSINDTTVTTTSTVTLTANDLAGGLLSIESATAGAGFTYKIKSHPAATAAVVTFTLEDPIVVATTGTVQIDVFPNPFNSVIIAPTAETSAPVGVAVYNVTNAQFGWLGVTGPFTCLTQGAVTVGDRVVLAGSTAAGAVVADTGSAITAIVGNALTGIASTDYGLIYVTLE